MCVCVCVCVCVGGGGGGGMFNLIQLYEEGWGMKNIGSNELEKGVG